MSSKQFLPNRCLARGAVLLFLFALCPICIAHPGIPNSIDHETLVHLYPDKVSISYSLYLTELLALGEMNEMNTDGDNEISKGERDTYFGRLGEDLREGLELVIDGQKTALKSVGEVALSMPFKKNYTYESSTLALEPGPHSLEFHDKNYPTIVGYLTIDVVSHERTKLLESNLEHVENKQSNLTAADPLTNLPDQRDAIVKFEVLDEQLQIASTDAADERQETDAAKGTQRGLTTSKIYGDKTSAPTSSQQPLSEGRLARFIREPKLSPLVVIIALGVAFGLGAYHALTPGHGKTIVAAYLVGSQGTIWDAVFLGSIVTLTHTSAVIAIGLMVLFAKEYLPYNYNDWLELLSGGLILFMGLWMFVTRLQGRHMHTHVHDHGTNPDHHHGCSTVEHDHHSHHSHGHGGAMHSHSPKHSISNPQRVSKWSLTSLGVSGGIVPCPSAMVLLLLSVNINRVQWGLAMIIAFSIGLASVLITIGVLMVTAKNKLQKFSTGGSVFRWLPVGSAAFVTLLGLAIVGRSLIKLGVLAIDLSRL